MNPELEMLDQQYNLISAFEFYPFTRTSDLKTHKEWLEFFLKQLKVGGRLFIWQRWNSPNSIASSISGLKAEFNNGIFIQKRVPNRLVGYFINNRYAAISISMVIRFLLSLFKKVIADNRVLIISHRKDI